jgi:two-component system NarL family sensor kinase
VSQQYTDLDTATHKHPPRRRTRTRELGILKEIAEALNGAADVDQALREALARVVDLLGLRTGWVWLIDPQTGRFYSASAQDLPPFLADPVRMTGRRCWCIDAYRSGELAAKNIDVIECSRLRAALGQSRTVTRGLRYHASIPLYFGGRQLGIMNVATRAWRKLTARELDLLSTIASQVGVAIERARLAEASVSLARVEERARLGRDLHDTLTQGLTAIGLHVEAAMTSLDADCADHPDHADSADRADRTARHELERALEITRANLAEARRSLRTLKGSVLDGRPLAEALTALGRQLTADTGVRVHITSSLRRPLPPEVEEALYRIASEALTNVRRHAAAREVEVALTRKARAVRLSIADDGKGLRGRKRGDGFGIEGMRERARLGGGRLAVRSRAGRGTTVVAEIPVADTEATGRDA